MFIQFMHFAIAVLAFLYVVTQSSIFTLGRLFLVKLVTKLPVLLAANAIQLIYCPACLGFWAGLVAHNIWLFKTNYLESACAGMLLGAVWFTKIMPNADAFQNEVLNNDNFKYFMVKAGWRVEIFDDVTVPSSQTINQNA